MVRGQRFRGQSARWIVDHRWLVLAASLVFAFAAAGGASRLGFIDEYRVFFGPGNPQLIAFDELEAIYRKNDNVPMASRRTNSFYTGGSNARSNGCTSRRRLFPS